MNRNSSNSWNRYKNFLIYCVLKICREAHLQRTSCTLHFLGVPRVHRVYVDFIAGIDTAVFIWQQGKLDRLQLSCDLVMDF